MPSHIPYDACPIHGTAMPCSLCAEESAQRAEEPVPEGGYAIRNKPPGFVEYFLILVLSAIIGVGVATVVPLTILSGIGITLSPLALWLLCAGLVAFIFFLGVIWASHKQDG